MAFVSTLEDATSHLQAALDALAQARAAAQEAADDVGSAAHQLDAVGYGEGAQTAAVITNDLQSIPRVAAAQKI